MPEGTRGPGSHLASAVTETSLMSWCLRLLLTSDQSPAAHMSMAEEARTLRAGFLFAQKAGGWTSVVSDTPDQETSSLVPSSATS